MIKVMVNRKKIIGKQRNIWKAFYNCKSFRLVLFDLERTQKKMIPITGWYWKGVKCIAWKGFKGI